MISNFAITLIEKHALQDAQEDVIQDAEHEKHNVQTHITRLCAYRSVSDLWIYLWLGCLGINMIMPQGHLWIYHSGKCLDLNMIIKGLMNWGGDKMGTIPQSTFSNAFSWMKAFEFRLTFHCTLQWKFDPKDQINNISALVPIMALCHPGFNGGYFTNAYMHHSASVI